MPRNTQKVCGIGRFRLRGPLSAGPGSKDQPNPLKIQERQELKIRRLAGQVTTCHGATAANPIGAGRSPTPPSLALLSRSSFS